MDFEKMHLGGVCLEHKEGKARGGHVSALNSVCVWCKVLSIVHDATERIMFVNEAKYKDT